jgi:hypothetical protein
LGLFLTFKGENMGQAILELRKRGAKNREINESIKAAMELIEKNRQIKEEERQKQIAEKIAANNINKQKTEENEVIK